MRRATLFEKAALVPPVLAVGALAASIGPDGYVASPQLALGALCIGVVSGLFSLLLALRAGRPHWLRWAAAGEAAAFLVAVTWLLHFLSTVPLS